MAHFVLTASAQIFSDTRVTIEDIMKEKGQLIKKGTLGTDGDVEFWDDGTETAREGSEPKGDEPKGLN
jgi:protein import protein ZIM17